MYIYNDLSTLLQQHSALLTLMSLAHVRSGETLEAARQLNPEEE